MSEVKTLANIARCQIASIWCLFAMIPALLLYGLAEFPYIMYAIIPIQVIVTLAVAVLTKKWFLLVLLIPAVFPYWNLAALFLVSRTASRAIRAEGFSIGLLGAKMSEYIEPEDVP